MALGDQNRRARLVIPPPRQVVTAAMWYVDPFPWPEGGGVPGNDLSASHTPSVMSCTYVAVLAHVTRPGKANADYAESLWEFCAFSISFSFRDFCPITLAVWKASPTALVSPAVRLWLSTSLDYGLQGVRVELRYALWRWQDGSLSVVADSKSDLNLCAEMQHERLLAYSPASVSL